MWERDLDWGREAGAGEGLGARGQQGGRSARGTKEAGVGTDTEEERTVKTRNVNVNAWGGGGWPGGASCAVQSHGSLYLKGLSAGFKAVLEFFMFVRRLYFHLALGPENYIASPGARDPSDFQVDRIRQQ